jgi:nitrogen-specific signal transduction histidine kinase
MRPYPVATQAVGQGTGIGLSISWDIVKIHGGSMKFQGCLRPWHLLMYCVAEIANH